jgi:hypothetical protein
MSARRSLLALALVAVLVACGGPVDDDIEQPVGDPTPTPGETETVEPPDAAPADDGDAPMPELPPMVADWSDDDVRVDLPNGWTVHGCEGDAPLLCVSAGDRPTGFLELGRYPLPDAYDGDDRAYLASAVDDFVEGMRADRAEGCPDLDFEATPAIDVTVGGHPGLRGGFRLVDGDGREIERHIVYWTADGEHVAVTVPAYAADGCLEAMGEFTPEDLGLVALFIDRLVADTPLPPAQPS